MLLGLVLSLASCTRAQSSSAGRTVKPKLPVASRSQRTDGSAGTKVLAARYLAVAEPADDQLDDEVDSYADHEHHNLAVAQADLRREIATEQWFDEHLLKITFPPAIAATAKDLVLVNNRRIALTTLQAHAVSISELVSFDQSHKDADAAVETQVRRLRKDLGLPPPDPS
jgi:hypothetical protein